MKAVAQVQLEAGLGRLPFLKVLLIVLDSLPLGPRTCRLHIRRFARRVVGALERRVMVGVVYLTAALADASSRLDGRRASRPTEHTAFTDEASISSRLASVSSSILSHLTGEVDASGLGRANGLEVLSRRSLVAGHGATTRGTKNGRTAQYVLGKRRDFVFSNEFCRHNLIVAHLLGLGGSPSCLLILLLYILEEVRVIEVAQLVPLGLELFYVLQLCQCFALLGAQMLELFL